MQVELSPTQPSIFALFTESLWLKNFNFSISKTKVKDVVVKFSIYINNIMEYQPISFYMDHMVHNMDSMVTWTIKNDASQIVAIII